MAFTVSEFKSKTAKSGGTARPSLFQMTMAHAKNTGLSFTSNETILVKAASIPPATIAPLAVNYHGRAYKWQGFRTFDNWTTTIINDENFSLQTKEKLEQLLHDCANTLNKVTDNVENCF